MKRKTVFNKKVLAKNPGEVIFSKGDLVQIYQSDLDYTFKTEQKLLPKWSTPQRVVARHLNSNTLETLNGDPLPGFFSTRRLRRFIPKEGTRLAEEQQPLREQQARAQEEVTDSPAIAEGRLRTNPNDEYQGEDSPDRST